MSVQGECAHRYDYDGRSRYERLPNCDRPKWLRCLRCEHRELVRCGTSNERSCAPCGVTYRRRVRRVCSSGFKYAAEGALVFLTFTAPGSQQHYYRGGIVCPCTPAGGVEMATWNGNAVHRWNRLRQGLERAYGVGFQYFKAVEVQERGALHLHVVARFQHPVMLRTSKVRALAIRHGFGHAVDVQVVTGDQVAGYLAKYVSKASSERRRVPYCHRATGEIGPGRWRTWTASRKWGSTMRQVKAAQARWAALTAQPAAADLAGAAGLLIPDLHVTHPGSADPP